MSVGKLNFLNPLFDPLWITHHSLPSAPEISWPYLQTNYALALPLTIKMEKINPVAQLFYPNFV